MADSTSMSFRLYGQDVSASSAIKKVGQSAKETERDLKGMDSAASKAAGSSDRFGKLVSGGFSLAMHAAGALAGAIGLAGGAILKAGLEAAAFNQNAQISLTTLIGSATEAKKHLADLKQFALSTPFELQGLTEVDQMLLGVGVHAGDTLGVLQTWGDYASALSISQAGFTRIIEANTQAIGAGRYTLEDLNQIANNGATNIYPLLAQALGKSVTQVRKMATEGKLTTAEFNKLYPVLQKNYFGNMQKQSATLSGVWSNLKDTFTQGAASALQNGGFVQKLTDAMNAAIPMLSRFFDWLGKFIPQALTAAKPAFADLGRFIGWLGQNGPMIADAVVNLAGAFYDFAAALAGTTAAGRDTATTGVQIADSLNKTAAALKGLADLIGKLHGLWAGLNTAMDLSSGRWVMNIDLMANVGMRAVALLENAIGHLLMALADAWSVIPGVGDGVAASLRASAQAAINDAADIDRAIQAIRNRDVIVNVRVNDSASVYGGGGHYVGSTFVPDKPASSSSSSSSSYKLPNLGYLPSAGGSGAGGGAAASARKNAIKQVAKDIGADMRKALLDSRASLVSAFESLMNDLANAGSKRAQGIASKYRGELLKLASVHDTLVARLKAATQNLDDLKRARNDFSASTSANIIGGGNVTQANGQYSGIVFNLQTTLYKARAFGKAIATLKAMGLNRTTLRQLLEAGPEQGLAAAQALVEAGKSGVGQVNSIEGQLETSARATGGLGAGALYDAGVNAARGLIAGLKSQKGALEKQMLAIAGAMAAAIKKALGIRSPSRVFADIGGQVGDGLIQGMTHRIPLVTATAAGMLDAAVSPGFGSYRRPTVTPVAPVINNFHFPNSIIGNEQHVARTVTAAQKRTAGRGIKV